MLVSYIFFVYYLMQLAKVDKGSPVDMAKSYMQARPLWASPLRHSGSRTPSPMAIDLFKDEKLSSVDGSSFPSAQVLVIYYLFDWFNIVRVAIMFLDHKKMR